MFAGGQRRICVKQRDGAAVAVNVTGFKIEGFSLPHPSHFVCQHTLCASTRRVIPSPFHSVHGEGTAFEETLLCVPMIYVSCSETLVLFL